MIIGNEQWHLLCIFLDNVDAHGGRVTPSTMTRPQRYAGDVRKQNNNTGDDSRWYCASCTLQYLSRWPTCPLKLVERVRGRATPHIRFINLEV
jgi:hypothetical protein